MNAFRKVKRARIAADLAWKNRSMKRETSIALLIFWAVLTAKLFWMTDVALVNALAGIYGILTPTIFMFAMAAFGFDAYVKQIYRHSQNNRNNQYTPNQYQSNQYQNPPYHAVD